MTRYHLIKKKLQRLLDADFIYEIEHTECFRNNYTSEQGNGKLPTMQQDAMHESREEPDELVLPVELDEELPVHAIKKFSYKEVKLITENFLHKIGEGGFGSVYYGACMNRQELAVKQLSKLSRQGRKEFHNEVLLLSKIHHNSLVPFVGVCEESGRCILLYEYMPRGNLGEHLFGKNSCTPLDWNRRLRIALNVAEGLEYLHKGCCPPIIHRDVKSSDILLNESYDAKVADFGISKLLSEGATHSSTDFMGTFGYVDPEYLSNICQLTTRSDVYSFGVVLFEIICGRKSIFSDISSDFINLSAWACQHLDKNRLGDIIDPLLENYNIRAMSKVAKIARSCVQPHGMDRPDMNEVVTALREAMAINKNKPGRRSLPDRTSTSRSKKETNYATTLSIQSIESPNKRSLQEFLSSFLWIKKSNRL
ncbi:hypothetical protein O6H91_17G026200 [Diphasiastrum complanatum]|uniref:Uncharacterized protein n=1 Tax=Diphasiastrum complanatum TaxID=34168 RepID=A0ACC2B529_DIPCM|nr:hypothetical protein O6H91_17G026200 [Diphasiastrum complanatum]